MPSAWVGLNQCAQYSLGGGYVSFDQVVSGEMGHNEGDDINHYDGIGGQYAKCRPGVAPGGNVETLLQDGILLGSNYARRSAVELLPDEIGAIQGGLMNVAGGGKTQTGCYIDSVEISCEVGEPVRVSYTWLALSETADIIAPADLCATPIFCWQTGQLEIDSSEFLCQSFTFTLKNNLRPVFSLDAGVVGSMRCPDAIVPGIMEVSLSAEVRDESGIDLMADRPAAIQFHFAAGNGSGRTLVIDTSSSAGLNPTSAPVRFVGGSDDVTYAIEAEANHNDLNAWGVSVG